MKLLKLIAILSGVGILMVWVIYPLIVAVMARRRRVPARDASTASSTGDAKMVSIIIASRDDATTIHERVADIHRSAPRSTSFEIVIALDACGAQAKPDELADTPNVRVVRGDEPGGKAAALNAAVRVAAGDLLVFTDTKQRFEPDAVARLIAAFDDPLVGAASGRLELAEGARRSLVGRYWACERWLRRCEAAVHSCVGATGAIWALRKRLWNPLPGHLILDDVYAPMQVVLHGHRVVFVDDARAIDIRSPDPSQEYRRKVRTLTGVVQLCVWLPAALRPSRNPIWLQFIFHKVLRLLTPYWLISIAAWFMLTIKRRLAATAVAAATPVVVAVSMIAVTKRSALRAASKAALMGAMLQGALIMGAVNGLRGRWDVWR